MVFDMEVFAHSTAAGTDTKYLYVHTQLVE